MTVIRHAKSVKISASVLFASKKTALNRIALNHPNFRVEMPNFLNLVVFEQSLYQGGENDSTSTLAALVAFWLSDNDDNKNALQSFTDDNDNDIKCSTDDNNDNDNVETSVLGEVGRRTPLGVVRANTSGLMR